MSPQVVPRREIGVIVLASGFKQVRVVGDELTGNPGHPEVLGDVVLPQLDRPPWPPQEIPGSTEQIVTSGHAGQRRRVMAGEAQRPGRKSIKVGRFELPASVGPEHVPVKAVE